jgi:hypothetical protein
MRVLIQGAERHDFSFFFFNFFPLVVKALAELGFD